MYTNWTTRRRMDSKISVANDLTMMYEQIAPPGTPAEKERYEQLVFALNYERLSKKLGEWQKNQSLK